MRPICNEAYSPQRHAIGLLAFSASVLLAGCMTSRVEEIRQSTTGISAGEAIVILTRRDHTEVEAEESFTGCVEKHLSRGDRPFELRPQQEFVDYMFPWFEPRLAPRTPDALPELLRQPGVKDRITASGVRYLVWVDGATQIMDGGGSLSCTAGPTGAGCFGFTWWDKDSDYEAAIWDLKNRESAGTISADVEGTSYMPAIIVPIPLIARTQSVACRGLAQQIASFIVGDS